MQIEEIERIIKSTVHIVMSDPKTHAPQSVGSGSVVSYNGKELLITVAHVTDDANGFATCILTGNPPVNNQTELYSVGAMYFFEALDITNEVLKNTPVRKEENKFGKIDFSVAPLRHKINYKQNQVKMPGFTIEKGEKIVAAITFTEMPNTCDNYGFFGRIRTKFVRSDVQPVLLSQEVFYEGLKFIRKIGKFYEFQLPNVIDDQADFQGTSGAPIMDTSGNIVSLITHGYKGDNKIYGIALSDFKTAVDVILSADNA